MKKTLVILSGIILSGLAFEGCKKGENDPALSLHTRKARLCGEWKIKEGTSTSTSGGNSTITTWTETSMTQSSGGTSMTGTAAKYNLTIEKDGTWKMDMGATFTVGTTSTIWTYMSSGTWNWLGRVGEAKNKASFIMRTLSETDTYGGTTTVSSYTGDDAPTSVNYIDQLKNKEMIVIWNGTTSSGGSTSSDVGEMTFIQE